LIDNWEDTDVISQVPVAWIPRQLLVVVPTDGKRYGFNALDLIRWMKRNPSNPCSRDGWRCIEIAERFIKMEQKRLGIQKREKRRMNIWKCEQAQLHEMQCVIDRFHRKHYHREKERKKQETFITDVNEARSALLANIRKIQATTVMNRITARITNDRVQSINYQCTVTNMKEKPMQRLIDQITHLMETLCDSESDEELDTSSSESDDSDDSGDSDDSDQGDSEDQDDDETSMISGDTEEESGYTSEPTTTDDASTEDDDDDVALAMEIELTPP
jgi:hypothetical protein